MPWFQRKKASGTPGEPPAAQPAAAPAQTLSISRLLSEDLILAAPVGADKDKFMEALARRLCEKRKLGSPAPFLAKVHEREQGISTTLDTGLSMPHARMDNLEGIAAVLGLVPQGMPDPKQPDLTIRAMFMFFSPNRQEAFTQHLHLLRGVSALFQAAFIEDMLKDPKPEAVLALIRSKEQSV
ncbi:MAG TPA: PTS sugar transporter subunit IIA [Elusimicrobiota bacterium]|nr:PTS sugar transporter subunit IIA [Elusimicrobiota bacterium]